MNPAPERKKKTMKRLSTLVLGASMILGTAAFAAQTPAQPASRTSTANKTKPAKKAHKNHLKSSRATTAVTAPAVTPAPSK